MKGYQNLVINVKAIRTVYSTLYYDLLHALHARDVPLAILTRNNQDALEWTFKKFALEKFFPAKFTNLRDFPGRIGITV